MTKEKLFLTITKTLRTRRSFRRKLRNKLIKLKMKSYVGFIE